jgi:hypothetical protein
MNHDHGLSGVRICILLGPVCRQWFKVVDSLRAKSDGRGFLVGLNHANQIQSAVELREDAQVDLRTYKDGQLPARRESRW